jgi:hypothetical protein
MGEGYDGVGEPHSLVGVGRVEAHDLSWRHRSSHACLSSARQLLASWRRHTARHQTAKEPGACTATLDDRATVRFSERVAARRWGKGHVACHINQALKRRGYHGAV